MYLFVLGNSILQIICPVVLGGLWSLCIFDKDDHHLHVLDPILSNKGFNHLEARHLEHVQNMIHAFHKCSVKYFPQWSNNVESFRWKVNYWGLLNEKLTRYYYIFINFYHY